MGEAVNTVAQTAMGVLDPLAKPFKCLLALSVIVTIMYQTSQQKS